MVRILIGVMAAMLSFNAMAEVVKAEPRSFIGYKLGDPVPKLPMCTSMKPKKTCKLSDKDGYIVMLAGPDLGIDYYFAMQEHNRKITSIVVMAKEADAKTLFNMTTQRYGVPPRDKISADGNSAEWHWKNTVVVATYEPGKEYSLGVAMLDRASLDQAGQREKAQLKAMASKL